jgi:hypothetical protein
MFVYLDEAFQRYQREGRIRLPEDVDAAAIEGASAGSARSYFVHSRVRGLSWRLLRKIPQVSRNNPRKSGTARHGIPATHPYP